MLNSKKTKTPAAKATTKTSPKKETTTTKKGDKYDVEISKKREQIEVLKSEIKALLAEKLNKQSGKWKVGDTVYYPAPPQKVVIPCKLEIEEDGKGDIVYFARPICVDKKTGKETMSKRHYSLGTDLSKCEDLYDEAPKPKKSDKAAKKSSKDSAKKSAAPKKETKSEKKDAPAPKSAKKPTLGAKKKPSLGKKK